MGEKYFVQCPMFIELFRTHLGLLFMSSMHGGLASVIIDGDDDGGWDSDNRRRHFVINRRLVSSLLLATNVIDKLASDMYAPEECHWQRTVLGHTFTMSRGACAEVCDSGTKTALTAFKSWLQAHEEAQVMLASVLVVVGVWWLMKAVLALLINLLCPILVVLLAVVCVPQLRAPLLGQNYPVVANLLRNILLKMADNIKT